MTDIPENSAALVGREFVHFKGGHYRLRGFAKDSETLYIIVVNRAGLRLPACALTFWAVLFCFLCVAGCTALSDGASAFLVPLGLRQWAYALFLAFVPTLLSLVFLTVSVSCVGSTVAAVLGALEPIVAVGVAVVAFGEAFTLRLAIGMAVVLASVVLVVVHRPISSVEYRKETSK